MEPQYQEPGMWLTFAITIVNLEAFRFLFLFFVFLQNKAYVVAPNYD